MPFDAAGSRAARSSAEPSRAAWFDLTALRHPGWWLALAVLVVNDQLLKGRGVVPSWLTGKLSDFALVVVAPTLLAAILPRRLPWRRTLALVSVLGLFVATELSPAVSDGFVAAMTLLGLRTKLWPDPTDLLALACLPLTIRLVGLPQRRPRRWSRTALGRVGVVMGAAACFADSSTLKSNRHAPYLLNARTGADAADIRVTWVLKNVPCGSPASVAAQLGPDDLDDPLTIRMPIGHVAALDGIPPAGMSPLRVCSTQVRPTDSKLCVGAILETDGAQPVLFVATPSWNEIRTAGGSGCGGDAPPEPVSQCAPVKALSAAPDPDAVTLQLENGVPKFTALATSTHVQLAPIDVAAVAARPRNVNGCRALADDVRALLAAPTCKVSSDCLGLAAPQVAGAPPCEVAINVGAQKTLQDLEAKLQMTCLPTGPASSSCGPPHPATCLAGQCVPACPDVHIPSCPRTWQECPGNFVEGAACARGDWPDTWCKSGNGGCHCADGVVACGALPPPLSPTCPLTCIDTPGGFVDFASHPVDGGSANAIEAGADASDDTSDDATSDADDAAMNDAGDAD